MNNTLFGFKIKTHVLAFILSLFLMCFYFAIGLNNLLFIHSIICYWYLLYIIAGLFTTVYVYGKTLTDNCIKFIVIISLALLMLSSTSLYLSCISNLV